MKSLLMKRLKMITNKKSKIENKIEEDKQKVENKE